MKGHIVSMHWKDLARAALEGAETGTMSFPRGVQLLMEAGFDGYAVDFRQAVRVYYRPDGETLEHFPGTRPTAP